MTSDKPWRRNLYSKSSYSDSYTDVTFLANLRTNVNQPHVNLTTAVLKAGLVTEQVCMVFIFFIIYLIISDGTYQTETVLLYSTAISCLCYCVFLRTVPNNPTFLQNHSKITLIFLVLGYLLSPVLKTLTETISSDTIDATTIVMMLVHIIFYDYKVTAAISSRALSLNAAIFASLCLASRLDSSFDAFVLLIVSTECFVLYPTFASAVRGPPTLFSLLGLVIITLVTALMSSSYKMSIFLIIVVLFINSVCPTLFVHWQKHKMNIHGPWDEAIIENNSQENIKHNDIIS